MTAFSFVLSSSAVAMVHDTLVSGTDGDEARHCGKAFTLPHLRTVVGATGKVGGSVAMQLALHNLPINSGFDEIRERWAELCEYANIFSAIAGPVLGADSSPGIRFYVCGWSLSEQRMAGFVWESDGEVIHELKHGLYHVPDLHRQMPIRGKISAPRDLTQGLVDAHRDQDAIYAKAHGGKAGKGPHVGGAMLYHVVTRDAIHSRCLGHLSNSETSPWRDIDAMLVKAAA